MFILILQIISIIFLVSGVYNGLFLEEWTKGSFELILSLITQYTIDQKE